MKKITKILDSVMSRLKRTCVAKAIAVVAVATIAMNSFAQQEETITGVKDLAGKDITYINDHLTDGSNPAEMDKMFFLYNEKTGKFLNLGSYWGTHVALADYGKPLWVVSGTREICLNPDDLIPSKFQTNDVLLFTHNMATTLSEDQGPYVGWPQVKKKKPAEDRGVFSDRKNTADDIYGWELEFTGGNMNTCKLKTKKTEKTIHYFGKHYCWSDDVYLCGVPASVDPNRSCEAYSAADIESNGLTGYDTWRIMTYEDIYNLQNKNTEKMTKSIDFSFMLKCPGFQRTDNDIKNWKTYNFATKQYNENNVGFASFGLSKLYSKAANWEEANIVKGLSKTAYTFDNRKYTTDSIEPYQRHLGKFYCASVKSNRGIVYQDVTVKLAGTYVVECKGFSTTDKAALVAGVLNPEYTSTNGKPMMIGGVLNRTTLSQTSNMTADEQTRLHIGEKNMDYAGKEFYEHSKYTNSVIVVVPQSAIKNGSATIRLGVMVGSQTETAAQAGEWTVFDDFRLLYASKNTEADLILDQDRADLSYIYKINEPLQNKTLRLNKTFTAGKWNTLVLPVNLTLKQLRDAFGSSTRLAELELLTESGIQFQSVDFTNKAEDYVALEAYKPYLIIPEKDKGQAAEYTSVYVETGSSAAETMRVKIAKGHFVIPKVSLSVDDLKKVNQTTWATTVSESTDHMMQAWGTLARTFGTVSNDVENGYLFENNGQIITGRDKLIGSYFFDNGKMYHSDSRVRGLRGFSCWFKPVNGKSQNAQFTLDGVTQSGTTALDDIFADGEQPVSRFAQGVYNLNGQLVKQGNSTAGLPSGLYIVNGKKCIVR
ncbi:MAG: hypothetical protein MSB00_06490 [Prevotella sp.]|nr:hypothetical protein [Prevotella sp.]